jgi:uncharacterized protein YjbI with pentapeptide repeats
MEKVSIRVETNHSQADELQQMIADNKRAQYLDLTNANFTDADLSDFSADRLQLQEANLRRVRLGGSRLGSCYLQRAHLEESDWSDATIRMCVFDGASAVEARFDGARLEDSSAKGANWTRASLRNARLTETSFDRTLLCEARLDRAEGDGVSFRGADLRGACLNGAKLDEADFRGADLRGADLSNGRFHAADFRGALLDDALFTNADLAGALFDKEYDPRTEATTQETDEPQAFEDSLRAVWQQIASELPSRSAEIEKLLGMDEASIEKLIEGIKHVTADLDGASDPPPEAWRSWLEPLMAHTESGQPFDLDALIESLSTMAQGTPHKPRSARTKRNAGINAASRRRRKHRQR